jgi:hypothetical protein
LPTSLILEATPNGFAEMNIDVFTNYKRIKEGPTKKYKEHKPPRERRLRSASWK